MCETQSRLINKHRKHAANNIKYLKYPQYEFGWRGHTHTHRNTHAVSKPSRTPRGKRPIDLVHSNLATQTKEKMTGG